MIYDYKKKMIFDFFIIETIEIEIKFLDIRIVNLLTICLN